MSGDIRRSEIELESHMSLVYSAAEKPEMLSWRVSKINSGL